MELLLLLTIMYLSCGTNCNELSLQSKRFLLGISNIANGQNINTVVSKLNDQLTKQNELLRKQYLAIKELQNNVTDLKESLYWQGQHNTRQAAEILNLHHKLSNLNNQISTAAVTNNR